MERSNAVAWALVGALSMAACSAGNGSDAASETEDSRARHDSGAPHHHDAGRADGGAGSEDGSASEPDAGTGANDSGTSGFSDGSTKDAGPKDSGKDARDSGPIDASPKDAGSADAGAVQTDCAAHPSVCGYPDGTNTGVTGTLTPSGSLYVDTPGVTIENLDVKGDIIIIASNVTVRNVRVTATGGYWLINTSYAGNEPTGIVLDHIELDGAKLNPSVTGLVGDNFTATAINVHDTSDAIDPGGNTIIKDSYIHDLWIAPSDHTDGMQIAGGGNSQIIHNTVDAAGANNAAIFLDADLGSIANVTVTDNLVTGVAGRGALVAGVSGSRTMKGVQFLGNRVNTSSKDSWTYTFVPDGTNPILLQDGIDDSTGLVVPAEDVSCTKTSGCSY